MVLLAPIGGIAILADPGVGGVGGCANGGGAAKDPGSLMLEGRK